MRKVCILINSYDFLLSHRKELILELSNHYELHIISNAKNKCKLLQNKRNIFLHEVNFANIKLNLFMHFKIFSEIFYLLLKIKPELLHMVTIKPNLYGGIASRLIGIKAKVFAISGLGIVFSSKKPFYKLLKFIVSMFYRFAFNQKNSAIICQNQSDIDTLKNIGIKQNFYQTNGSGIDLANISYLKEPEDSFTITYASRLLIDKGILDFVEAASMLKDKGLKFIVAGIFDEKNLNSISKSQFEMIKSLNYIDYIGVESDVIGLFTRSNVVVLPSYYGEGLPKTLIEASACGRPVITTDTPGCSAAVQNMVTGILVPVKNPERIAEAITTLYNDPKMRASMGESAYHLAREKFNVIDVVRKHTEIYRKLLNI